MPAPACRARRRPAPAFGSGRRAPVTTGLWSPSDNRSPTADGYGRGVTRHRASFAVPLVRTGGLGEHVVSLGLVAVTGWIGYLHLVAPVA